MLIPDVNVLLYSLDASSREHRPCARWLADALHGVEPVGFSWQVLLAVIRLTTRAAIFARPLSVEAAFEVVDDWLARPASTVVHPTERHSRVLRDLLVQAGTAGNLTTDAHLAALGMEHGATLVSCDRDFARFTAVAWLNPSEPPSPSQTSRPRRR